MAPAKALVGPGVIIDTGARSVHYFHILCDRHVVLVANGLPAESLLPGDQAIETAGRDPAWSELAALLPKLAASLSGKRVRPAAPILKSYEASLLRPKGEKPAFEPA